jgi:hypothetical protein
LLFLPAPSFANWHEASSDHFVVIASQNEKAVREFTERLERYHSALVYILGKKDVAKPSPSNRVTIYVVSDVEKVQKLFGDKAVM